MLGRMRGRVAEADPPPVPTRGGEGRRRSQAPGRWHPQAGACLGDCDARRGLRPSELTTSGAACASHRSADPSDERLTNCTKAASSLSLKGGRWKADQLRRTASTLICRFGTSDDAINEYLDHIKQGNLQDRRQAEQALAFDAVGAS